MNQYQNHDFSYYLRGGHGRAYILLRYETDDKKRREYREAVIHACLHDPRRFDPDFFPMIYYTTLCPNERCEAFRIMEELGMLTSVMLEEGVHDSEDPLQKRAKELLA